MLGALYADGAKGVCVSPKKGREWLLKASKNGNKDARAQMAGFFQEGIHTEGSSKKAVFWFESALDKKDEAIATKYNDILYLFSNKNLQIKCTGKKNLFEKSAEARFGTISSNENCQRL